MSDEECPMAKRIKFESSDESKLTHFDVIDEVQGDGSASECGKEQFYQIVNISERRDDKINK